MLYTIVQDSNKYLSLTWDDAQITALVGESDMEKRIDMWNSPRSYSGVFGETLRVYFIPLSKPGQSKTSKPLKVPDICAFQGRLFLNKKAYEVLKPLIELDGEFLPVVCKQGDGFVFTPLRVAEEVGGLDTKLSVKNEWGDLENLAFHEERLKSWSIFRAEFNVYMTAQCNEEVKNAVEKAALCGVFFTTDLGNGFSNQFDDNVIAKN